MNGFPPMVRQVVSLVRSREQIDRVLCISPTKIDVVFAKSIEDLPGDTQLSAPAGFIVVFIGCLLFANCR
jgi:hypothetical protein